MGARAVRDPALAGVHHLPPGEPPGQPAQQHHGQEVRDAGEEGWGLNPAQKPKLASQLLMLF